MTQKLPRALRCLLLAALAFASLLTPRGLKAAYTGAVNPLPSQIGSVTFTQSGQPNDASLARTGGKTYTFTPTAVSSTATVYWGAAEGGIRESFVNAVPAGLEIFTFSQATAANVGVWTGRTTSPTNGAVVYLRFTMTVRAQGGQPITLTPAANLGLPASVGLLAPVTAGAAFNVHFIFEASSTGTGGWQPALEFFDNIPFKNPALGGTAQTSFSSGYYYQINNTAPSVVPPTSALTNRNTATPALAFSVADAETVNSVTVSATSSDQAVVANSGIVISGSGATRSVVVTPVTDAHGTTVITLTASDGSLTGSATFNVTVNQPPRLNANTPLAVTQGASAVLMPANLRASDTVSTEEQIIFTVAPGGVGIPPSFGTLEKLEAGPIGAGGTFTMADVTNGQIVYVSDGTVTPGDSFQFGVTDHQGGVAYDVTFTTFRFNIQVTIVNQAPKAVAATYAGGLGAPVSATLGVSDVDSTEFTFDIGQAPANGSLTSFNPVTGAFTYAPATGFSGTDTFTYTVADAEYTSGAKTITIVVANQSPTVEDIDFRVAEGAVATGEIEASDPDLPAQTLIFTVETAPLHGVAAFTGEGGNFTYTSTAGFFGTDTFTYSVSDGTNVPVIGNATVTVTPVLAIGRLLVADSNGRQVVLVDPLSGREAVLSKDGHLTRPLSLVVTKAGKIAVLDEAGLVQIDPATGTQVVLAPAASLPDAGEFGRNGLTQGANGTLYVANAAAGIVAVNPVNGEVTQVGAGTALFAIGVGAGQGDELFATNVGLFTGGESTIVRIDPVTGVITTVSAAGDVTIPSSVTVESDGNLLVCNVGSFAGGVDSILRINPTTGAQTVLTSGGSLNGPFGIGIGADGKIYVGSEESRAILQIDPVSGAQTMINASTGALQSARDILVLNAPIVASIGNQETDQNEALAPLAISVTEPEVSSDFLELSVVSDNQILVPSANIAITGTGPNRVLAITPALNKHGVANITLTATDGLFTTTRAFALTVHHVNQPPVAVDDEAAPVIVGQEVEIDVLANDSDVDEDQLTIVGNSVASLGTLAVVDGKIVYTAGTVHGSESFTYTIRDPGGSTATATVSFEVVPPAPELSVLLSKGGVVPGAGSAPGVPANSKWASFGLPAINASGDIVVTASTRSPGGSGRGIFELRSSGALQVVALAGSSVPGISGAVFAGFRDPLLADDGSMAFIATLKGASVTPGTRTVACTVSAAGVLSVIARTGTPIAAAGGATLKGIAAVEIADGGSAALRGTLNPSGSVTQANDSVVLTWDERGLAAPLREGVAFGSFPAVKSISTLLGVGGAAGSGRGWLYSTSEGAVLNARVTFVDGSRRIAQVDIQSGDVTVLVSTGMTRIGVPESPSNSTFKTLGIPSFSWGAANAGTFRGVLVESFTGIFDLDQETGVSRPLAVIGAAAPGLAGATIKSLKDPVLSIDGTLKTWDGAVRGNGITSANDRVLYWSVDAAPPVVLAREGATPPGYADGARWKAFTSLAAIGNGKGPIFTATLENRIRQGSVALPGPGGVTAADDSGLWAVDSRGTLQLLIREGQVVAGKTVKTFKVLKAASGTPGARRSFNASGQVVVVINDLDGSSHIALIELP